MNLEKMNAKITRVWVGVEDHGILTLNMDLQLEDGLHQGFGGYNLKDKMGQFLYDLFEALEVRSLDELPGQIIRIKRKDDLIVELGHPLKNQWFVPEWVFRGKNPEDRQG